MGKKWKGWEETEKEMKLRENGKGKKENCRKGRKKKKKIMEKKRESKKKRR